MGGLMSQVLGKDKDDPPEKKDPYDGLSPEQKVHAAACSGDVKTLEQLHAEGVDLNTPRDQDGLAALDSCAWSGNVAGALALLKFGADPSATQQAIVGAAAWGSNELLEALLDAGGPVDQEMGNYTALHWAVEMGIEDCSCTLVKRGAWKLEPQQDLVLLRARRKRYRELLECIAEADPARKEECVAIPWWHCANCEIL